MKRLLLLVVLLLAAVPLYATDRYVSTAGNDGNSGVIGSPWLTIQHGFNSVACGDTLYIRSGTYSETLTIFYGSVATCSGWGSPITISAYPGETVTINNTGHADVISTRGEITSGHPTCPYPESTCIRNADFYWILKDLIVDGVGQIPLSGGIVINTTRHFRLNNVRITGVANIGLSTNADPGIHCSIADCSTGQSYIAQYDTPNEDIQVLGGRIDHSGQTAEGRAGHDGHGFYATVRDSLIDGVEIDHNYGMGTQFTNSGAHNLNNNIFRNNNSHENGSGMIMSNGTGGIAYNNIVWGNGFGISIGGSGNCISCALYNNTAYNNVGQGIDVGNGSVNGIARNNIGFSNGVNINDAGFTSTLSNNFGTADPQFTNAAAHDFTLQSTSGAIGYGMDLSGLGISALLIDINGDTRINPPSAGAYEFGGVASASIVNVSPVFLIQGATTQDLTFTGNGSHFDGTSVGSTACSGVTINSTTLVDILRVTVNVTVSGGATVATCNVSVNTGSGAEIATGNSLFSVMASATPAISTISPNTAAQGTAQTINVVGTTTNFAGGMTCALSVPTTGITVGSVSVANTTNLSFTLTLTSGVTLGVRDFSCTDAMDGTITVTNGFTINAPSGCSISGDIGCVTGQYAHKSNAGSATTIVIPALPTAVSSVPGHYVAVLPAVCKDGSTCTVTTDRPVSSITSGLGLTYTQQCTGSTSEQIQDEIWMAPGGAGTEQDTVNYGGSTVYFGTSVAVELFGLATSSPKRACGKAVGTSTSPSVSSDDTTPQAGDLVICVATNVSGEIISATSPLTAIEAIPGNTFAFKIASGGGTQTCSFTQASSAWWTGIMIVLKPNTVTPPSISVVSASSCAQVTADCQIDLTGVNTHWTSNSVPTMSDLGGIATISFARNSATSATWHVSVSGGASLTTRDVIVTEGEEIAMKASGFTVTYTQQARFTPFHWRF